jgi:hypothetical protein
MPQRRIDERPLVGADLSAVVELSSRAFFDDPFFSYLLPDDTMRRSLLPFFFRAVYTHMGEHGRIVTVRNDDSEALGVAAWLTTGGYPLPIKVQLSQVPSSLRASIDGPGPSWRAIDTWRRWCARIARIRSGT